MTCPFCEPKAFDEYTNRHINDKPFGFKKILVTLEKRELEHLEQQVDENYKFSSIQHYLRILIHKDRDRVLQSRISRAREPDIPISGYPDEEGEP